MPLKPSAILFTTPDRFGSPPERSCLVEEINALVRQWPAPQLTRSYK